jgi:hypothetical protein
MEEGVRGEERRGEHIVCVEGLPCNKSYLLFSHSIPFVVLYVDVKLCECRDGEGGGEEIDQ